MSKLVIVESPAKAKTIGRFLGKGYTVEASYGHVRDLPGSAAEIPEAIKKKKWARLGVNVESDFDPIYIVPADKKKHVARLKDALKGADELLLATDEDREGESIVWHLLELLKPKVPVRRIVFHEITPEAIKHAVENPRDVDSNLVKAQESRRIIDRLYGYTLSPLLWKKVQSGLSAGRVQSVAVKICVERERERAVFVPAEYWDLAADLASDPDNAKPFPTTLVRIGDKRLATGRDFEQTTGELKPAIAKKGDVLHLQADAAKKLAAHFEAERKAGRGDWDVSLVETTPGKQYPAPPFITSTLQQEANRKLGFSAQRTMRAAQDLYEGVDLGGERVGLITYMRTDSVTLADRALRQAGEVIADLYGREYYPGKPRQYSTTARNAQEAHEAIRPTELNRRPADVEHKLSSDQARLYELIWKRTIASQMKPAEFLRTKLEIESTTDTGERATFATSGKAITFPGFLRAYVEGSDDPEAELADKETILPELQQGQKLVTSGVKPQSHETTPPARYTEASLIKQLEAEGIGRPSTYASIIGTIQDRGYIFRQSKQLVPTFTAYAVTQLLEAHFDDLVDLQFTSRMEEELDRVADGSLDPMALVSGFYRGSESAPGIEQLVRDKEKSVDFPHIPLTKGANKDAPIVVRIGRYGPFLQRKEGGTGNTASIPPDMAPADLDYSTAEGLIEAKSEGPRLLGKDPGTDWDVTVHNGRFGPYVQTGPPGEKVDKALLRRASLIGEMTEENVTLEQALGLLSFPRELGPHPDDAAPVQVLLGRYGPYVKHGKESRSLAAEDDPLTVELPRALELLAAPPQRRGRGRAGAASGGSSARELGAHPQSGAKIVVKAGRYGPYVTDGETNATLPKTTAAETVTLEQAVELIAARAAKGGTKKKGGRKTTAQAAKSGSKAGAKKGTTNGRKKAGTATKKKTVSRKSAD